MYVSRRARREGTKGLGDDDSSRSQVNMNESIFRCDVQRFELGITRSISKLSCLCRAYCGFQNPGAHHAPVASGPSAVDSTCSIKPFENRVICSYAMVKPSLAP